MSYTCERCGYTNNLKSNFRRHLQRKIECKPIISNISVDEIYKKYFNNDEKVENEKRIVIAQNDSISAQNDSLFLNNCSHCNRSFKRKSNLVRHLKTCKNKKEINEIENAVVELQEQLDIQRQLLERKEDEKKAFGIELRRMLKEEFMKQMTEMMNKKDKEMMQLIAKTGSTNIKQENSNNLFVSVKLNAYDKTDYSHITDQDYLECIRRGNMGIPDLIRKLHFNPDKPENHNIYINNIKSNYIKLFNGMKWDHRLQYETINMMVQDNANIIEDKIEEWYDTNHEFSKAKYKEILDKYPRFLNRLTDSKYVGKKVEEEVKLTLFNFRDMIIQNNKRLRLKF